MISLLLFNFGFLRFGEDGVRGWKFWMVVEYKIEEIIEIKKIFKVNFISVIDESDFFDDNDDEFEVDKDKFLWENWV